MAQVASPYGFRIAKLLGDLPFSGGMHTLPLTANQAKGYFFGDPISLVAGQPVPIAATPTTTLSANSPIGIFMGCSYQDPVRGFVNAQQFPANGISAGYTQVQIKIADWPYLVMQVQANGSVVATQVGMNAALVVPTAPAGNVQTGNSLFALDSTTIAATATLALRIYDFVYNAAPSPGNSSMPGDPFTDCLVVWNFGVHRYLNSTGE